MSVQIKGSGTIGGIDEGSQRCMWIELLLHAQSLLVFVARTHVSYQQLKSSFFS